MATYPPNQTTPAKGSGNYLWNWLGSSLKKFGAAISPYITGGSGYKSYVAEVYQDGTNEPQAIVHENTIGAGDWYLFDVPLNNGDWRLPILPTDWRKIHIVGFGPWTGNAGDYRILTDGSGNIQAYYTFYIPTGSMVGDMVTEIGFEITDQNGIDVSLSSILGDGTSYTPYASLPVEIRVYP